jgi:DNA repair photolyase
VFVRWDNLRIDTEPEGGEAASLPGYKDDAVVRRFDAPEALETRFYEVRAKSVLNRVPPQSRMPFRWTINPYRGCTHACSYCVSPDTPVLMADGRQHRIADLKPGDRIIGTEQGPAYRRFVETTVQAKWTTTKPAYRVSLADGTELVASGDHRFLSDRGWKHVIGAGQGPLQRASLTPSDTLLGTGRFAEAPTHDEDYRRGWLCGMLRANGTIGHDGHDRLGWGVGHLELQHVESHGSLAQMVSTGARSNLERTEKLIRWPLSPSDSWRKGFLAGIFDAEGHRNVAVLRIANADEVLIGWALDCLRHFGFDAVLEDVRRANGPQDVQVRGGLVEQLRLIHTVDPAIGRKCSIAGQAIGTDENLGVVSIEPLGRMQLCDITTGTGDFIANGVVSHNCFARPTHKFLGWNPGRDFEKEIVVKVNAPEVLRAELRRPSWAREHVALGTNTDPYQWVESKYKLMPGIWEALRDARTPSSVLTKSPLLVRDMALMKEIAEVASFTANLSIPTLDKKAWRDTEPHTPNPRARLEAVAELNRNGIPTGILIAPLMPGINDDPRQVEDLLAAAADAGATGIGGLALHLRGEVRGVFMDWLRSQRPDLVPLYEELYAGGAYAPAGERRRLAALLRTSGAPPAKPFSRDPDFQLRNVDPGPPLADGRGGAHAEPTLESEGADRNDGADSGGARDGATAGTAGAAESAGSGGPGGAPGDHRARDAREVAARRVPEIGLQKALF